MNHLQKTVPANGGPSAAMPQVKGLPVIGSLPAFMRHPIEFLREQHDTYGDVFRFKVLHKEFVVLAGLEANRFIAGSGREYFGSQETWGRFLKGLKCPHLFIGVDGEAHQYQRKLFKPQLSKAAFKEKLDLLVTPIEKELLAIGHDDRHVGPLVRNIICKQIGMALQGIEVSSRQTEEFMLTQNTLLNIYLVGKWPKLAMLNPKFLLAASRSNRFSHSIREQNKARKDKSQPTYLDQLERGQREHPEWFTEGDMRAQTMLPFIGGVDPVGGTLSFLIYELLKQPELYRRVQAEVDRAYEECGGFPGLERLEQMEDVKGLILETMRLYPIAYAMSRSATEDFEFQGYSIEQDQEMMVFTVANHFNADYFPEPERFDIERYRAPRNEHKQGAVYAPFGRGPHTCVAAGLAELQLMVNTVVLLRKVEMAPAIDLQKVHVEFLPGPFMSKNFKVRFKPRALD